MTRGLIFWVMMLLWVLAILGNLTGLSDGFHYARFAPDVFAFVLFGLLGWDVYGSAVKGK